ncbi:MAG: cupin domain-containing protein [Ignavibacteriales bacterium]|nr:cupin domain-containing protein [Ignavibacteriales bacterium]
MRYLFVMGSITILALILVSSKTPAESNSQAMPSFKNLITASLSEEFTKDREVLMDLVEIPPNTTLDRHWHPGEEFHYYMEGEVEIKIEGEPPIVGKPGEVGHVPFKKKHQAISGDKGAKILVFRVHTKGKPWRYIE